MKILIAHDGAVSLDVVVDDMRRAGLPADARSFVVCVTGADSPQKGTRLKAAMALTDAACDRIQAQFPHWALSSDTLPGPPADVILKTSQWWRPDLLVIGSDAFAHERTRTTSVPLELVHRARCSVRVARPPLSGPAGPIRLVIGNNGSKACEAVIREVARRQWPENTQAHVLTVVAPASSQDEPHRAIDAAADAAEDEYVDCLRAAGVTADRRFIHGDPRQELVRESESSNADTIFVGPRCFPSASRFLLGSVATAVVTRARSTVEVVRSRSGP